jgi:hypothetical protein
MIWEMTYQEYLDNEYSKLKERYPSCTRHVIYKRA